MNSLHTLFPKARAEVIRLLFSNSDQQLHLRELARLSGLAVGTLQSELQKLEASELLSTMRDGNRLYFRANTEHPLYPELHGIALKTSGLAERLGEALADLDGIQLAFVFGSFAKDQPKAQSDVDLFVVGGVGLRALSPRLRPVSEEVAREINPYVISAKSLAAKSKSGDAFIANVLSAPKQWIKGTADELATMV